jgi:YebC/PmpR family DNA-binding regulatory protein
MAGHNKWSKVKHIKAVVDAKRGKIFARLAKEISLAAKAGGGNPDSNARLRSAILAARNANVPNDNISRAIKKGTGEGGGAAIEEVLYECFAPGGVGLMIEVVTDNRNRAAADMRSLMTKNNGNFAESGSVAHMFSRKGELRLSKEAFTEDTATELALESGADDVIEDEEDWVIYTTIENYISVGNALREKGHNPKSQRMVYVANTTIEVTDPETAKSIVKLYDVLDDYDDTQNVYANFDLSDEAAAALDA